MAGNKVVGKKKSKSRKKEKVLNRHSLKPDLVGSKKMVTVAEKTVQKKADEVPTMIITAISTPIFGDNNEKFYGNLEESTESSSKGVRYAWNWLNKNADRVDMPEEASEEDVKVANKKISKELEGLLQEKFGLDVTESRNAINVAIAQRKSRKELIEGMYIPNCEKRINSLNEQIKNTTEKVVSLHKHADKNPTPQILKRLKKKRSLVNKLKQKVQKEQKTLEKWKKQLESGVYSLCFGSSELLRNADRYLNLSRQKKYAASTRSEYRRKSAELYAEWELARNSEYKCFGAKGFLSGNQKATLAEKKDGSGFDVSVAGTKGRGDKYRTKGHGTIIRSNQSVRFGHADEYIRIALTEHHHESRKDSRCATKYPITFLFKKGLAKKQVIDENGKKVFIEVPCYRIHLSFHIEFDQTSDSSRGAIGIDINSGSIDVAYINGEGNYVGKRTIKYNLHGRRSEQNEQTLSKVLKEIVEDAQYLGLPIVKEDLKFDSSGNVDKSKKFRRMAGSVSATKINDLLTTKCWKAGVELIQVNPAYSSFIGMMKYMKMYGINSGVAAGIVIARRGLGFEERLPKWIIKNSSILPVDGCLHDRRFWSLLSFFHNQKGGRGRDTFFNPSEKLLKAGCFEALKKWNDQIERRSEKVLTK